MWWFISKNRLQCYSITVKSFHMPRSTIDRYPHTFLAQTYTRQISKNAQDMISHFLEPL